jgi:uncharacterized membrane-anchored protein YjiN (DUF445 family)
MEKEPAEAKVARTGAGSAVRSGNLARDLRRSKAIATAFLAAATSAHVGLSVVPGSHWLLEAARATAEAAMIGGIADWFAVVALFRHPLGLPIPHTGIIPANKNRISAALGQFIQIHLLDPDELASSVEFADVSGLVVTWLRTDSNAQMLADETARALPGWISSLDDAGLKARVKASVRRLITDIDLTSTADAVIAVLLARGEHFAIIDMATAAGLSWLQDERPRIEAHVNDYLLRYAASYFKGSILDIFGVNPNQMAGGLVSPRTARELTEGIIIEISGYLKRAQQPDSEIRHNLYAAIQERLESLKNSREWAARLDGFRAHFLDESEFDRRFEQIWAELRKQLIDAVATSRDDIAAVLTDHIRRIADAMATDEKLRTTINKHLVDAVRKAMVEFREKIGAYAAGIMQHWSAETMSRIVEQNVGRDLQFVRINGTIVGGLVGLILYIVHSIAMLIP